jgi:hypothetical protein
VTYWYSLVSSLQDGGCLYLPNHQANPILELFLASRSQSLYDSNLPPNLTLYARAQSPADELTTRTILKTSLYVPSPPALDTFSTLSSALAESLKVVEHQPCLEFTSPDPDIDPQNSRSRSWPCPPLASQAQLSPFKSAPLPPDVVETTRSAQDNAQGKGPKLPKAIYRPKDLRSICLLRCSSAGACLYFSKVRLLDVAYDKRRGCVARPRALPYLQPFNYYPFTPPLAFDARHFMNVFFPAHHFHPSL